MGYDELAFFFKSVMLDRMRAIAHIILRLMDVKKALVLKCFFFFFCQIAIFSFNDMFQEHLI